MLRCLWRRLSQLSLFHIHQSRQRNKRMASPTRAQSEPLLAQHPGTDVVGGEHRPSIADSEASLFSGQRSWNADKQAVTDEEYIAAADALYTMEQRVQIPRGRLGMRLFRKDSGYDSLDSEAKTNVYKLVHSTMKCEVSLK
jgi:hypothetical protein